MTNDRADLAPSRPPIEEWPDRVRARLQARPRRYRFPAPRFRLSFRAARRTGSSRRTPPAWRCYDSPGMSMGDTLRSILTRLVAYVAVVIAAGPRRRAVDQAETGNGSPSTGEVDEAAMKKLSQRNKNRQIRLKQRRFK